MDDLIRKVIHRSNTENRPQGEILKEELQKIKKAQGTTDQSKSPEHDKNISSIISSRAKINNDDKNTKIVLIFKCY